MNEDRSVPVGASSLLADVERQLEHFTTGRYSAFNRHPVV